MFHSFPQQTKKKNEEDLYEIESDTFDGEQKKGATYFSTHRTSCQRPVRSYAEHLHRPSTHGAPLRIWLIRKRLVGQPANTVTAKDGANTSTRYHRSVLSGRTQLEYEWLVVYRTRCERKSELFIVIWFGYYHMFVSDVVMMGFHGWYRMFLAKMARWPTNVVIATDARVSFTLSTTERLMCHAVVTTVNWIRKSMWKRLTYSNASVPYSHSRHKGVLWE